MSQGKDEQLEGGHTVSMDTLQQSSQVFDDPIARVLDDVCYKNSASLANHVPEKNLDDNLVQRSPSLSCLTDFSFHSTCQDFHSYEEMDEGDFCSV